MSRGNVRRRNPSVTGAAALSLGRASVHLGQWLHKDIRPVPAALTLRTCLLWDKWFYPDLRGTEKRVYRSRAATPCSCIPVTEGLQTGLAFGGGFWYSAAIMKTRG